MTRIGKAWSVGVVVATVAVQSLWAMSVSTVNGYGPYQRSSGGEFTLLPSSDLGVNLAAYSSVLKTKDALGIGTGTFQTFCLEHNEFIERNTTYQATIDNVAMAGGRGGLSPDPLSLGAAWLYREFAAGTLVGNNATAYDYTATRKYVTDLQDAIWFLEEERGAAGLSATALAFLGSAYAANGGSEASARLANNGTWNVKVLNITRNGVLKQSQLVMVPDGGMTVVLLGMALGGMGMIARRYR
jgi:hypothetical protein